MTRKTPGRVPGARLPGTGWAWAAARPCRRRARRRPLRRRCRGAPAAAPAPPPGLQMEQMRALNHLDYIKAGACAVVVVYHRLNFTIALVTSGQNPTTGCYNTDMPWDPTCARRGRGMAPGNATLASQRQAALHGAPPAGGEGEAWRSVAAAPRRLSSGGGGRKTPRPWRRPLRQKDS